MIQGLRELFSPEGVNVFEYQDSLEQEIEMDNRYNEWNIVISILCILLCFSIIGLIIYFMYIYISPPIGNDLKEILKLSPQEISQLKILNLYILIYLEID